jgi:hypothetical protein
MVRVRATSELFCELRKIIPQIPERTRSLSIHLAHDLAPLVKCEFFVSGDGCPELLRRTFELVEKEQNGTECPRAVAEAD